MLRAVKFLFSAHANCGGSRALDVRSHLNQQFREVCNFRFARGVLDEGFALGQGRRHQNVLRSGDGNFVEENVAARQASSARSARFHVAVGHPDFGAHLFERFQMQVHRPRADRASAGGEICAWPLRATRGPSVRIEARMVFTSSYGASAPLICSA